MAMDDFCRVPKCIARKVDDVVRLLDDDTEILTIGFSAFRYTDKKHTSS